MSGELEIFKKTQAVLDDVSPSFCMAKWLQVTLHLQNGKNHSCHHPQTHHTPLSELVDNPSALHNTSFKKEQRKLMVDGKRPTECQYCWNVEDLVGNHVSDRIMKSSDAGWAGDNRVPGLLDKISAGEEINPTYVEVSFSNACNFKCSYCSPVHSSKWTSEISNQGPYQLSTRMHNDLDWYRHTKDMPIHHKEYNPYVEAFWEWWPELSKTLKVFRITGGEPLIEPNTFKVIDFLSNTPLPDMEFSINSNLGVPTSVIDTYIEKMSELIVNNKIRRHCMYTSVDGHGKQAEYGRHGLDYEYWLSNVNKVLTELPTVKIVIMCTTNIFSITTYKRLLQDVYDLKIKYQSDVRDMPITIDTSILRWPHHQCLAILPNEYADLLVPALDFMKEKEEMNGINLAYQGFFQFEIEKLSRLVEFVRTQPNASEGIVIDTAMRDFYLFVNEHDRRRGTDFLATFPELEPFYMRCKALEENMIKVKNIE
jgi:organic radical activating enzyme